MFTNKWRQKKNQQPGNIFCSKVIVSKADCNGLTTVKRRKENYAISDLDEAYKLFIGDKIAAKCEYVNLI